MKKPILLMLSGGADSTAALWALKDENVHVHHVHIINREGRDERETKAVEDILKWMSAHGYNFPLTDGSVVAVPGDNLLWDSDITMFVAGALAKNGKYERVAFGATKDDEIGINDYRRIRGRKLFSSFSSETRLLFPVRHLTKFEAAQTLPKELFDLTWSCRTPVDNQPCGTCSTCRTLAQFTHPGP